MINRPANLEDAFIASQRARLLAERRRLSSVLAKIAEGTYGFSDESGEPIARARLEAYPEAIRTVAEEELRDAGSRAAFS